MRKAGVQIKVEGFEEVNVELPKILEMLGGIRLARVIKAFAMDIEGTAKENIQKSKASGKRRKKGKRPSHTASAPGQYPAIDTGIFWNSIRAEVLTERSAVVGSQIRYGRFLEEGTKNMSARPWLAPSLEESSRGWDAMARRLLQVG